MSFTITRSAIRPAGDKERCFYCSQLIGKKHKPDCVLIQKKVNIKMTVEYEVSVPSFWGKSQIEFQRNEGSWCANNAISELSKLFAGDDNECMCVSAEFEYMGGDSLPFLDEE